MTRHARNLWLRPAFLAPAILIWAALGLACGEGSDSTGLRSHLPQQEALVCDVPFAPVPGLEEVVGISPGQPALPAIIDNPDDFCRLWDSVIKLSLDPCDLSGVDFRVEVVLVADLWSLSSDGQQVEVVCTQHGDTPGSIEAYLVAYRAGKNCILPQWIVNPVAVVKVPVPVGSVAFDIVRTYVRDCV